MPVCMDTTMVMMMMIAVNGGLRSRKPHRLDCNRKNFEVDDYGGTWCVGCSDLGCVVGIKVSAACAGHGAQPSRKMMQLAFATGPCAVIPTTQPHLIQDPVQSFRRTQPQGWLRHLRCEVCEKQEGLGRLPDQRPHWDRARAKQRRGLA
eukprot:2663848-Rhodomonas_salina.4